MPRRAGSSRRRAVWQAMTAVRPSIPPDGRDQGTSGSSSRLAGLASVRQRQSACVQIGRCSAGRSDLRARTVETTSSLSCISPVRDLEATAPVGRSGALGPPREVCRRQAHALQHHKPYPTSLHARPPRRVTVACLLRRSDAGRQPPGETRPSCMPRWSANSTRLPTPTDAIARRATSAQAMASSSAWWCSNVMPNSLATASSR